jgi:hypothetical protein
MRDDDSLDGGGKWKEEVNAISKPEGSVSCMQTVGIVSE